MRAARRPATSSLASVGHVLDALGADQVHGVAFAAEGAGGRRHVVGHDPVAALAAALVDGVGDQVLGLGGEAHDQRGTPGAGLRQGGQDVRVGRKLQRRRLGARLLLDLGAGRPRHLPVGDGGGTDRDVDRAGREAGRQHLVGRVDVDRAHARRIGDRHRATHQRDLGAEPREGRRDGMALLARGMVGDVAHRIDRLARRARRHQRALAGQRLLRGQHRLDGGHDLRRLRHAAGADARCRPWRRRWGRRK